MLQGPLSEQFQNSKDVAHNSWKVTQVEHGEIHSGNYYTGKLSTSSIGASSWLDLELITPSTATAVVHLFSDHNNSGGMAEIILCDLSTSSTYTHGTTGVSAINHNLLSTKTANMSIFTAGTNGAFVTSTMTSTQATLKDRYYSGSTGTNARRGAAGGGRNQDEFVLAGASTYVLRLWNRSAAGAATLAVYWYED